MQPWSEHANWKAYHDMSFVEYLEFIARIAHAKGAGDTLKEKIEYILDDFFTTYGYELKEVVIEEEEIS